MIIKIPDGSGGYINFPTIKGEKGEPGATPSTTHLLPKDGGQLESYTEKLNTFMTVINLNLGNVFSRTITADTTFTIANAKAGAHSFTLYLVMGATTRTLTFPASVKWANGEIPDMSKANTMYILTFSTINAGTTWYGNGAGY